MDLQLTGRHFLVCGASSGFGKAITLMLLQEGAFVTGVARSEENLLNIERNYATPFNYVLCDLFERGAVKKVVQVVTASDRPLNGIVLNAGGPPVGSASSLAVQDLDRAFETVVRWKIDLTLSLLPELRKQESGRILFVESQSLKQPIPDLVLSNSMRAAVAGFAKTLSREVAGPDGITVNILAPGSHDTPAIQRIIDHKTQKEGLSTEDVKKKMEQSIPAGRFGKAGELASLAVWLLSPHAGFVTGQTISHDGGNISGFFG